MTDDMQQFEDELRSLRPHGPSSTLRDRIASQMAESGGDESSNPCEAGSSPILAKVWQVLAAAACIAIGVLMWLNRPGDTGPLPGPLPDPAPIVRFTPIPHDGELPTLLTYHRAMAESEEALDELLDRHARRGSHRTPAVAAIGSPMQVQHEDNSQPEKLNRRPTREVGDTETT